MSNAIQTATAPAKANNRRRSWRKFTDEERAAYKEEKHARQKALADFIGKLTEEDRAKILKAVGGVVTIEEHSLSETNTILCFIQRGGKIDAEGVKRIDLSVVGGFNQWKNAGRRVKKGEKGMAIWFPREKKAGSNKGEEETALAIPEQILDKNGEVKTTTLFSLGTVFDISQTEPIAAPEEMPLALPEHETIEVEAVAV